MAKIIETVGLPDVLHMAAILLSKVQEALSRWRIKAHKGIPVMMATDQGANIATALHQSDKFFNVPCTSQPLCNIMFEAIKKVDVVKVALKKVIRIVHNLNSSPKQHDA